MALSAPSALGSPPISGSTVRTCPDGVHNNVVPRNCPAAVMHLVVIIRAGNTRGGLEGFPESIANGAVLSIGQEEWEREE